MSQLTHNNVHFQKKEFPITLILDSLQSPANIGGIFRLADAFGVENIILYQCNFDISSSRFKRTSRHTEKALRYRIIDTFSNLKEFLTHTKALVLALEITTKSHPIRHINIPKEKNIVLIIGSERYGVSTSLLELSSHAHIAMYGQNSSMNVSHATAIALFEITKSLTSLSNN